jgi:hypothetical protein
MRALKLAALAALMVPSACQADEALPIPAAKVDAPVPGKSAVAVDAFGAWKLCLRQ